MQPRACRRPRPAEVRGRFRTFGRVLTLADVVNVASVGQGDQRCFPMQSKGSQTIPGGKNRPLTLSPPKMKWPAMITKVVVAVVVLTAKL